MKGMHEVFVNGPRYNIVYRFHTVTGRAKRIKVGGICRTAGVGRRCVSGFLAVYVDPESRDLVLQFRGKRFTLDGLTQATHATHCLGLLSLLVVERVGRSPLVVKQMTPARAVLRRVDPAYDSLDESHDDFLSDVADIANSPERQRWILEVTDPEAGPWNEIA